MSQIQHEPSMMNRLLEEISWEGSRVRQYRRGGLGLENVLTAEVLMPLDFLPRTEFLGEVLGAAHGADAVRAQLVNEIEDATIQLLPDQLTIVPADGAEGSPQIVQPDALIIGPATYALVEAKRVKSACFGPEQLARELVALAQQCGTRAPLLLLLVGTPPPIKVQGMGRLDLMDALEHGLESVLERTGAEGTAVRRLTARPSAVVAWITWDEIRDVVAEQQVRAEDGSSRSGTTRRLAASLTEAIERHS